jgi:hypothetical protein
MKNYINIASCAAVLSFSLLSGCANQPLAETQATENAPRPISVFLPTPKGTTLSEDKSIILGTGEDWMGRATLNVPLTTGESFSFFSEQLPSDGWTPITRTLSDKGYLVFLKKNRTLIIEIARAGNLSNSSLVILTVSPSDQTAPRPGK